MKRENIMFSVIGLLAGIVLAGFVAGQAVNKNNTGMMRMMGINVNKSQHAIASHGGMSMVDMAEQLKGKSGDEFDKAFIEMMIVHHEGAIDMAKLIPSSAKHTELKILGEAIIDAQTREITSMKQWQQDWGYSDDSMVPMMHNEH